jgi:hypothetical protein
MGCLAKPDISQDEGLVIVSILSLLADKYPNAIYYPFRVTASCLGADAKAMVQAISLKLTNPNLEQFIASLTNLTHPHLRLMDILKAVKKSIASANRELVSSTWNEVRYTAVIVHVFPRTHKFSFSPFSPSLTLSIYIYK